MSKQALFEVGDKVRSPHFKGVLEVAEVREVDAYPVVVRDRAANALLRYTAYGKSALSDSEPTLRHADTGIPAVVGEPPERQDYPLYMRSNGSSLIVEFSALTTATVLFEAVRCDAVGVKYSNYVPHTNRDIWTPCEKSVWNPTKPTWCWVWDTYRADAMRRLVRPTSQSDKKNMYYVTPRDPKACYSHAEPCESKDIPDYWPEEWV